MGQTWDWLEVNHRRIRVDHSVLRIDQRIQIARREIGTDISGPTCIYAHGEVTKGSVAYVAGDKDIATAGRFEIFLPPFTLVEARLEDCDVTTSGIAFRPRTQFTLPTQPLLLTNTTNQPLCTPGEIIQRVLAWKDPVNIARAPNARALVLRTKRILDAEYDAPLQISRIAQLLKISPETLSRAFKAAYGIPPVRYRHQLRIMDALMRLAEGAVPIEVFQDVGFDDLSRFYKIFRKVACAAPGRYRPSRSKNAKT